MTGRSGRTLIAVVSVLLLAAATPQQKPIVIPGLGETIEVSLINVDVIVTDHQGHRVRGLPREAFEIYENGRLQPISNFAEYGQAAGHGATTLDASARGEAPAQRRTVVLFLEPFKLANFRVNPFIDSLKNLVRTTIRKGDSVSVVEYDRKLAITVPPTDDVAEVEAALDRFGEQCLGVLYDPTVTVAQAAKATNQFEADRVAFARRGGLSLTPMSSGDVSITEARLWAMQARMQMNQRVAAINSVIQSMASTEGRKMLILTPHRLGQYTGAEFFYAGGESYMPPDVTAEFDNMPAIRTIARNANAAGVTLYPMYAPGIDEVSADPEAPNISSRVMGNEMAGLEELAKATGGVAEWGTANIAKLMPEVAEDATAYYSLAYRATSHRTDVIRKVSVKMNNPALKVRLRSEFVEKSDDARMRDRVLSALVVEPERPPFAIGVAVGKLKPQGRKSLVPLQITIPAAALSAVPDNRRNNGAFSVYVVAGAENGDISDITHQTQSFALTDAQLAKAKQGHFTYTLEALVSGSSGRLAIGVLDEVSKSYAVARVPFQK